MGCNACADLARRTLQCRGMPQLPVLKGAVAAGNQDLVRYFDRINLEYSRHLAASETQLDCGTALVNGQLSTVYDANRVLDAALPVGMSAADAVAVADEHFREAGSACRAWVPNPSAPAEIVAPLVEILVAHGYIKSTLDILHLPRLPRSPVLEVAGLQIIPARASYRHARVLAEEDANACGVPQLADAILMHLEDPHFEAMLALKDGQPVALAGVLGVGEWGGVQHLFVSEPFRRQGIGRTMMSRVLEVCVRSLYQHVLLSVRPQDAAAQALYRKLGFEKVGEMVELTAPTSP
jgi:ribosomal protein S18 acetylase RimI-like enzyme